MEEVRLTIHQRCLKIIYSESMDAGK